jgi:hypothetical protein
MTALKLEHWPLWLQFAVLVPHALLASCVVWLWWPKSDRAFKWFGLALAYLLLFYFVCIR